MVSPLVHAARELQTAIGQLKFGSPVFCVYNPLQYAWAGHEEYLRTFGNGPKKTVFLGMNPGPFGMAQTGVPFGEVAAVRGWLGIKSAPAKPVKEHPRRPVLGFACARSEISGQRLWGLFAHRFGSPEAFFRDHFVLNYCPLCFMEETGRNRTPDKLKPSEKEALFSACDEHLRRAVEALNPQWVIGVGEFAFRRAQHALKQSSPRIGTILHPSPASPRANRDWAGTAAAQLEALGVWRKRA